MVELWTIKQVERSPEERGVFLVVGGRGWGRPPSWKLLNPRCGLCSVWYCLEGEGGGGRRVVGLSDLSRLPLILWVGDFQLLVPAPGFLCSTIGTS